MSDRAFAFNDSEFAYESFEDEIIVLDLVSGSYYTLGGSAIALWQPLTEGRSRADIVKAMAAAYEISAEAAAADLDSLLSPLLQDRILREVDPAAGSVMLAAGTYAPVQFAKHVDMQDLLTLDPIHDVDPQKGWPYTAVS